MKFVATIHEPMYDFNDKKYIRFIIPHKVVEIVDVCIHRRDISFSINVLMIHSMVKFSL